MLGFLQTKAGKAALAAGQRDLAEEAFRTALSSTGACSPRT